MADKKYALKFEMSDGSVKTVHFTVPSGDNSALAARIAALEARVAALEGGTALPQLDAPVIEVEGETAGGYTVTFTGNADTGRINIYVDDELVPSNNGEELVYHNISTIRMAENGDEESEYAMDDEWNIVVNEGETVTLTRDVIIHTIEH